MSFILKMAWRELQASWKRILFFFVCVAIGVGAIVGLRSIIQTVHGALATEARTLTAADILIRTERPWTEAGREIVDTRLATIDGLTRTESVETATMVRPADESKAVARMVELRGIQAAFPLYGEFVLGDGQVFSHDLLANRGALVRPELLTQLGIEVGDEVLLGDDRFTVRGVILSEPGRSLSAFSFGPRVLIDHDALLDTGLLTFGSRAEWQVLVRLPEAQVDTMVEQLQADLRDEFVRVRSYRRTEARIDRNLSRAENYLSLIGFVIVILGGIGVWSVTRVFIQQKLKSIAILKCLGTTTPQIFSIYLLQVGVLGLGGSLLGVALAAVALSAVPADLAIDYVNVSYGLTGSAVAQGVAVGLLVSTLFAVVPLLEVRHIRPALLLRHERQVAADRIDWLRAWAIGLVTVALVMVASWQAASLEIGLYVSGGFVGVAVLLHWASAALVHAVQPLTRSRGFALRHAVLSLSRPGNQTRTILLAVGLGSFFIIGVRALQANLIQELAIEVRPDAPDMFLIDIQPDQVEGVRTFVSQYAAEPGASLIPVVRARIIALGNRQASEDRGDDRRGRSSYGREYVVTYRDHLEENEQLLAGSFWPEPEPGIAQVSVEENILERFRVDLGDTMRFDVLGREVEARITSVRQVEWGDARRGGFMFVFRPGTFDNAPHTFIAVMQGPGEITPRARMQRDLVAQYPNVSVIDGREILAMARGVIDNVTLAVSVVGAVALLSGVLILVGSIAMTKFQRLYETAIFKTLGASSRTIAKMFVFEYGTLGTLAGLIGSAGAMVLTWSLSRYVLEIGWYPAPLQNLGGVVVTALVVGIVGLASSYDVLKNRPQATLRAE